MNSRWLMAVLGCGLVSLWATALLAAPPTKSPGSTGEHRTGTQAVNPEQHKEYQEHAASGAHDTVCRSSSLIGMTVKNTAGKDLGVIEDLVIDSKTGAICYAALARGGFLSGGKKLFAVPWSAFEVRRMEREQLGFRGEGRTEKAVASKGEVELILGIDPSMLDKKEGFKSDQWPQAPDASFQEHMKSQTRGTAPATQPENPQPRSTND